MEANEGPSAGRAISTADLRHKMDELAGAVSGALTERQVRLHTTGLAITIVGLLIAYRLGRRTGRRES